MAENTSSKVTALHLKRDAFLYVRQSTMQQLVNNTESTQRQYALRHRAVALGWPLDRVHIIDCDLGQSGASAADRAGFQQLVSEVSLGHAGIVLGLEVSRLARNSTDWHRLVELCALWDTLILDEDGLYDCQDFNDRLTLGLKGILSEVELHYIRARLRGGIINKAKRGEFASPLPVGFVYDDDWRVKFDPDEQVQAAVRLVFDTFARTGTARATLKHFRDHKLLFPRRLKSGPHQGDLVWGRLCHSRILQMLHNPRYAGAYFFGRTRTRVNPDGNVQSTLKDRNDWIALLPGAHAGYINWDQFEDNQKRLLDNVQAHGTDRRKSPAGEGPALLQGLVVCGACGRRMSVRYHERNGKLYPDYTCQRTRIDLCEKGCQHLPGHTLDLAVERLVLEVMTPISLEVALAVQQEILQRQQEVEVLREKQIHRAQYETDLARQRYMRCDPNNRLVANTLEAEWNEALRKLALAQTELEQQRQQDTLQVTDDIRERVMALNTDFPAVWRAPQTTERDRKRMLRLLIDDVTLIRVGPTIAVQVRFRGGSTTTLTVPAPQPSWQMRMTSPQVIAEIDKLLEASTDQQVSDILNERGFHSGTGEPFCARIIARLRKEYQIPSHYDRLRAHGYLALDEIAARLGVCTATVKVWAREGLLRAHPYTTKNECLYELPSEDAMPSKQPGRKFHGSNRLEHLLLDGSEEVHLAA